MTDSFSAKTWYYNHDTETFTSGPDLMEGRRTHGSALNVDNAVMEVLLRVLPLETDDRASVTSDDGLY